MLLALKVTFAFVLKSRIPTLVQHSWIVRTNQWNKLFLPTPDREGRQIAVTEVEGPSRECKSRVTDCLIVFPSVKRERMRIQITGSFRKPPTSILGRTSGTVVVSRDVDLLKGSSE